MSAASEGKTFPLAGRRFYLFGTSISLLLVFLFLCFLLNPGLPALERLAWLLLLLGNVFLAGLNLYQARSIRLLVSKDAIEYHGMGWSLRSNWDNVERIGGMPGLRRPAGEGLVLREPAVETSHWYALLKPGPGRDRFIPLIPFGRDWRNGELGQLLRRYAPQLFTTADVTPPPTE